MERNFKQVLYLFLCECTSFPNYPFTLPLRPTHRFFPYLFAVGSLRSKCLTQANFLSVSIYEATAPETGVRRGLQVPSGEGTKWSALAAPSTPLDSSKRQTTGDDDGNESALFLWSNRSLPLFRPIFQHNSTLWHVIYSFSSSAPVNVLFEYYYFYSLTPHNGGKWRKKHNFFCSYRIITVFPR